MGRKELPVEVGCGREENDSLSSCSKRNFRFGESKENLERKELKSCAVPAHPVLEPVLQIGSVGALSTRWGAPTLPQWTPRTHLSHSPALTGLPGSHRPQPLNKPQPWQQPIKSRQCSLSLQVPEQDKQL